MKSRGLENLSDVDIWDSRITHIFIIKHLPVLAGFVYGHYCYTATKTNRMAIYTCILMNDLLLRDEERCVHMQGTAN